MAIYLFAYHGGAMQQTPEVRAESTADWGRWFGHVGEALVDGGNPVARASTVEADGATRAAAASTR